MIVFTTASSKSDIQQILDLQWVNLPQNVTKEEAKEQGFVTVHHNYSLLSALSKKYSHIIAKENNQVVGYALIMLTEFENKIPVLKPMFQKINSLTFKGKLFKGIPYFVMGQVCINKNYRGHGIFSGLYQEMKKEMSPHFNFVITEIATRNTRSIRAHEKVGFEIIHIYSTEKEKWAIVAWNWK